MRVKNEIIRLLSEGVSYNSISEQLGCSKSTVAYHANKIGVAPGFKDHCWPEIQRFYDEGHTLRECKAKFGFAYHSWEKAVEAGQIVPRDRVMSLDTLMAEGRNTGRGHLKGRLIQAGLLRPECYECGRTHWQGQLLSLHLHHCNGNKYDNRLENLQLLCPNCHSLTPNYSGKNVKR